MKKAFLIQTLVLIFFSAFCQNTKSAIDLPFDTLVKKCGLIFTMPEGFKETKVKKFGNGFYQYAIKHKSGFEIRYYVKPYSVFYGSNTIDFSPNTFTKNFFISMNLDVSGNVLPNIPQIDEFPKEAVAHDFNGDYGATSAFKPNSEFGKGFEFCSTFTIRKDNIGEVIVFWMFTEMMKQEPLMRQTFTSLKFKK